MKKILLGLVVLGILWYACAPHKTEIKNVGNAGRNIVVFGDSLSYGQGAAREESYPALLAKSLGRPVINLGVKGGKPTFHSEYDNGVYSYPLEFGGNDRIRSLPFEQTVAAMEQMVESVQQAGAVAVIVDTGGTSLMSRYGKAYQKIAREKGAVFVPGILDGIFGKRSLMSDQIHPNAAGYKLVADKVEKSIKPYL